MRIFMMVYEMYESCVCSQIIGHNWTPLFSGYHHHHHRRRCYFPVLIINHRQIEVSYLQVSQSVAGRSAMGDMTPPKLRLAYFELVCNCAF